MAQKQRKPRPQPPRWFFISTDNCWGCKSRNACNGCKFLKQFKKQKEINNYERE